MLSPLSVCVRRPSIAEVSMSTPLVVLEEESLLKCRRNVLDLCGERMFASDEVGLLLLFPVVLR